VFPRRSLHIARSTWSGDALAPIARTTAEGVRGVRRPVQGQLRWARLRVAHWRPLITAVRHKIGSALAVAAMAVAGVGLAACGGDSGGGGDAGGARKGGSITIGSVLASSPTFNFQFKSNAVLDRGLDTLTPETDPATVASEWAKLDGAVVEDANVAPYGNELSTSFFSERMDFQNCSGVHLVYKNDWWLFCLK